MKTLPEFWPRGKELVGKGHHLACLEARYGRLVYFSGDVVVGRSLQEYGEWAQKELEFIDSLDVSNANVVDVGAYIGTHTLAFSRFVSARGTIYSIEPHPKYFDVLKENISINKIGNVVPINCALSDQPGVAYMDDLCFSPPQNLGGARISVGDTSGNRIQVEVRTLDSLSLDSCGLIKIDVEGMEANVLAGGRATIERCKPVVVAECNSADAAWPVVETMRTCNYCVFLYSETAFNSANYFENANNIFSNARELAIVCVPVERRNIFQKAIFARFEITPIDKLDDLVLSLIKKPQYKFEVLSATSGAALWGNSFWLNESEMEELKGLTAKLYEAVEERDGQIAGLSQALAERDGQIAGLNQVVEERDGQIAGLNQAVVDRDVQISEFGQLRPELVGVRSALAALQSSRSWRLMAPYRAVGRSIKKVGHSIVSKGILLRVVVGVLLLPSALAYYGGVRRTIGSFRCGPGFFAKLIEDQGVVRERLLERGRLFRRVAFLGFSLAVGMLRAGSVSRSVGNFIRVVRQEGVSAIRGRLLDDVPHSASPVTLKTGESPEARVDPVAMPSVRLKVTAISSGLAESQSASEGSPLLFCVSHIAPWPPRAGNEYRLYRLLRWLHAAGWDVVFFYCPLSASELGEAALTEIAKRFSSVIGVSREGSVQYITNRPDLRRGIQSLDNRQTRDVRGALAEVGYRYSSRISAAVETLCPDALIESFLVLADRCAPAAVLAEYVFVSGRLFPLIEPAIFKIVDTHDLFSAKQAKVESFGISDPLAISPDEEERLLSSADLILAIQNEEAGELRRIAPASRVITVGVDMDMPASVPVTGTEKPVVLLVGSSNPMNVKGLTDLLRFAWPRIRTAVPSAILRVVGSVGDSLPTGTPGIDRLGRVDDLAAAYAAARVVINPAVAGTGLKVKTLEALAHLRPIVLWPSGVEGLSPELRELCNVVSDWFLFTENVIRLLSSDDALEKLAAEKERIAYPLSPDVTYSELRDALESKAVVNRMPPEVAPCH